MAMGIAFTTVIIIVIRLIIKVMYGSEEIKKSLSTVKQSKSKRLKAKLKQKEVLESLEEKTSYMAIEIEHAGPETRSISEVEKKNRLGIANSGNENVQEIMDHDPSITDEGWIDIEKKEKKKKNKHSNKLFGIDKGLESTPFVKSVKKDERKSRESSMLLLKTNEKSKTDTNSDSIERVSYAQRVLLKSPGDTIKVKSDLEDQYLKQGAKSKTSTNSIMRTSYAQKVSSRLSNIRLSLEEKNICFVENEEDSIITSKDESLSSCMNFNQESSVSVPIPLSSGLFFKESIQCSKSALYRKIEVEYCNQLKEFRGLHFAYCIELINKIFEIQNDKLVVSERASSLFGELTSHTEILFFILKVFFLVNFSTLFGEGKKISRMRYCSTYFYDQSLLNLLILTVIMNTSKEEEEFREIFKIHCKHLCDTNGYEPHSGEFFDKVFNICYSLASVELPKEKQKLVDFAMLTCIVYCGHMTSALCRILFYNHDVECLGEGPLMKYLKAQSFCGRCYDLRKAFIHMYHPIIGEKCLKNVGDVIDVPLIVWRNCSRKISGLVIESASRGTLSFGTFVESMISRIKELILLPNTMRFYRDNIKMYDAKLKRVESLLPLPNKRTMCSEEESKSSKSL